MPTDMLLPERLSDEPPIGLGRLLEAYLNCVSTSPGLDKGKQGALGQSNV